MTISNLLTEWLETYQKDHIKSRTYRRYQGLIEMHIIPSLGEYEISEIGRKEIQEFLLQQKKDGNVKNGDKLSATSTNMMLSILSLAFEYAYDMEYVKDNPCIKVRRTKVESKKVEAFTLEEQRLIEQAIVQSDDRRLHGILLCLYTGLRIGELLGLMWNDVDFDCGVIKITKTVYREKNENGVWQLCVDTPKTKSSDRVIPLPEYIIELLKEDYKLAQTPYVVENKKGERMSIRSYQYMFEKITERAGVRKLNFHALRHTFATRAVECGIDIKTVADIMGHQNASITLNRYAHCMIEHKIQMMQRLPRVL
ncbi:MAG: site-specific integrase [Clostridia bacterium]|nr:site-specific integrase [Clostridia bacterium]